MNNYGKVSVIIPVYNREATIKRAIESVLNQTYTNLEVIVVDDNSSDNTRKIVEQIPDSRIKYIKNNTNLGAAGARNVGIDLAAGKYLAFQDSDDEWKIDKLEKQLEKLQKEPQYKVVYVPYNIIKDGECIRRIPALGRPAEELEGNLFETLLRRNFIGITLLLEKTVIDKVGKFNADLRAMEN